MNDSASLHVNIQSCESDSVASRRRRAGVASISTGTCKGVEPICKVLQIAPSCYRRHAARQHNPELRCARAKRDDELMVPIQRVWRANLHVYGADKVWRQMNREGDAVAR